MERMNNVFYNAIGIEVALELIGVFTDKMVLAEVAVVALATTMLLWQCFIRAAIKEEKKVKRCN